MTTTQVLPLTARPAPRHRGRARPWIPMLFVLAGVAVLLYPVAATEFNNIKQHQFAARYDKQVAQAAPESLRTDLERARTYNSTLAGVPILDPWLARVSRDPKSEPYKTYLGELARFDAMAVIRVPAVGIDLSVYHGTSDDVLNRGAGHLYGTSLPVGGIGTHAVLTGHRGLATASLFDHLPSMKVGDMMYIDVLGTTLAYKVDQIKIVLPNQIRDLTTVKGEDYLTLMTCTPYAVNSHRLLVRGHRVPYDPATAAAQRNRFGGLEGWMYWMLAGAAVGLIAIVVMFVRGPRTAGTSMRRRQARRQDDGRLGP